MGQLKNQKLNISLILSALIIGGFVGFRLNNKLVQKEQAKKFEFKANTIQPQQLNSDKRHGVIFLLPEHKDINHITQEGIEKLEAALKTNHYGVKVYIKKTRAPFTIKPETGIVDAVRLYLINDSNEYYLPLYTASPRENEECFFETQFLTHKNNNINTIEDLKNKNVGIGDMSLPMALITFKDLTAKQIKFNSLHVYYVNNEILASLMSEKTDVIALTVQSFSNNEVKSGLGTMSGNFYPNFMDLKVISTSHYKIPCNLLFIKRQLPEQIKQDITDKYNEAFYDPKNKGMMGDLLGVKSIQKMSYEKWTEIKKTLKDISKFDINSVADKIIIEKK